ncbi:MAG: fumarate hydratase [Candidatus Hecatellaceae archaeon]|nr:MAG: fumarate hydratase [Candidatus Hecatellales archaeon]
MAVECVELKVRRLEEAVVQLIRKAAIELPSDVKEALWKAYKSETSKIGRIQLKAILENITAAESAGKPLCQDTGLISFYVRSRSIDHMAVEKALRRAVVRASRLVPLRPSVVHPLTRLNTGNNTGNRIPNILWMLEDIDHMEVTVVLKGAGSENSSDLYMLPPGEGVKGVKRTVVEAVVKAGGQPCPPTIVNIGLGGTVDLTFKMAKLALIRPLGKRHPEGGIAELERELLRLVNSTGVGPMGLGGRNTALEVKIEYAHGHTASLPLAVNFQCWADRRATLRIHPDGSAEIF